MNAISEEQANVEWAKFATKFQEVGLAEHYDMDALREEILASPCTTNEDSGNAYKGALLIHINMVIGIAQRIAKMISGTFQIDENSLVKVCMLMHLGKRFMFEPTDSEWDAKRGFPFRFKDNNFALKSSDLSIIEAGNNGVHLLPEEYEAIKAADGDDTNGKKMFQNILSTVVRQANELAYCIEKERFKKIKG